MEDLEAKLFLEASRGGGRHSPSTQGMPSAPPAHALAAGRLWMGDLPPPKWDATAPGLSNPRLGVWGPLTSPVSPAQGAGLWDATGQSLHAQNGVLPANWQAQAPDPLPWLPPQPFGNMVRDASAYAWHWDPRDAPIADAKPNAMAIYRPWDWPMLPNGRTNRIPLVDMDDDDALKKLAGNDPSVYRPRTEVPSFAIVAPSKPIGGWPSPDVSELADRLHQQRYLKDSVPFEPIRTVRRYGLHDSMTRALPLRTTDKVNAGQWSDPVGYWDHAIGGTEGGNIGLVESHRKVVGPLFRDLIGHGPDVGLLNPDPRVIKQPKTTLRNATSDTTWYGPPDVVSEAAMAPQPFNDSKAKRGLEETNYFGPGGPVFGDNGRVQGLDTRERESGIAPEWANVAPADLVSDPYVHCWQDFRLGRGKQTMAQIDAGIADRLDPVLLAPVVRCPWQQPVFSY